MLGRLVTTARSLSTVVRNDICRSESSPIAQMAEKAFPEWSPEYYQEVKGVLEAEGLAQLPGGMMSGRGVVASRTTDKGQRFLDFITEPDEPPE